MLIVEIGIFRVSHLFSKSTLDITQLKNITNIIEGIKNNE